MSIIVTLSEREILSPEEIQIGSPVYHHDTVVGFVTSVNDDCTVNVQINNDPVASMVWDTGHISMDCCVAMKPEPVNKIVRQGSCQDRLKALGVSDED